MEKILLTLGTLTCFAVSTFAQSLETSKEAVATERIQSASSPEDMAKNVTDRIHAIVNLTPQQYEKILTINKTATEAQMMSAKTTAGEDAAGLKTRPTTSNRMEQIKAVLTPEQLAKLETARNAEEQTSTMQRVNTTTNSVAEPAKK